MDFKLSNNVFVMNFLYCKKVKKKKKKEKREGKKGCLRQLLVFE